MVKLKAIRPVLCKRVRWIINFFSLSLVAAVLFYAIKYDYLIVSSSLAIKIIFVISLFFPLAIIFILLLQIRYYNRWEHKEIKRYQEIEPIDERQRSLLILLFVIADTKRNKFEFDLEKLKKEHPHATSARYIPNLELVCDWRMIGLYDTEICDCLMESIKRSIQRLDLEKCELINKANKARKKARKYKFYLMLARLLRVKNFLLELPDKK